MARPRNNKLIYGLIGVVALLILVVYFRSRNKPKGEKVAVEKVEKRSIKENVAASGKIFPETEVKISSDVSGEIVELYVEEGDSVKAGQVLAKIDPDVIQSQVERGEASVNNAKAQAANARAGILRNEALYTQAEAQREQIEAQLKNSKIIYERNIKLHKDGVISDADFESSEANIDGLKANLRSMIAAEKSAKANLESAKQSAKAAEYTVKSSEASLKELRTSLRQTTIYAPTNGVVSLLNVEKGERVVGTMQMTGTEMMRVANLNSMEVQVDVSENDVLRVAVGDPVEIEVDAYLDRKFKGKVTQIANSASGADSPHSSLTTDQVINFVVKIRIDPGSYADILQSSKRSPFRPGMSASVEINTHTEENVLSIPIQAVTTREKEEEEDKGKARKVNNKEDEEEDVLEVVFVASGDTVKMMEVKTGIQDDTYIQILDGLDGDEDVVIAPYTAISRKLESGKNVRVVEEDKLYNRDQ
ncbi:MAG: efflux RND transporter periplasmic adaptor subunit [Bacteroidota bacterium]